jgi:hypothetical protein
MFLSLGEHKMPRGEERVVLELHPDSGTRTFPLLGLPIVINFIRYLEEEYLF